MEDFAKWIDQPIAHSGRLAAEPVNRMEATLDRNSDLADGDSLPPAWHWLYFNEGVPGSGLGIEGHPKVGGFMPPVPLPRRMWAGGTLHFHAPLIIGAEVVKRSTVRSVTPKTGRTGPLYFVSVWHEMWQNGTIALEEEQTIVYREPPRPDAPQVEPKPAPADAQFSQGWTPDPVMLFRYSALTFNGHRIHYDADFCRQVEGYPDLVVHGPLIATLLLDLFWQRFPADLPKRFKYRARSPLFNPHPFTVNGKRDGASGQAWATNGSGGLAMWAELDW